THLHHFVFYRSPTFFFFFFFSVYGPPRDLHSFPTRRSSDLKSFRILRMIPQPQLPLTLRARQITLLLEGYGSIRSRGLSLDWKRSEEHTSELQSRGHLVCRLLLEKKKKKTKKKNENKKQTKK